MLTVFAAISSSTAVVGLDPNEPPPAISPEVAVTQAPLEPLAPAAAPAENDPCSRYLADFCVEVPLPAPTPQYHVQGCGTGADHDPGGTLSAVAATAGTPTDASIRVRVEVESGLGVDGECFAAEALEILNDERGWSAIEDVHFVPVDDGTQDLRLILASPEMTDRLCYPARTVGKYSCRKQNSVIINLMRWETGTDDYVGDLSTYRSYLINHEVGHFLGRGHVGCPAAGELAPVMMQQTKGLGECLPNGWPTKDEH